jgi:hypothetical protein
VRINSISIRILSTLVLFNQLNKLINRQYMSTREFRPNFNAINVDLECSRRYELTFDCVAYEEEQQTGRNLDEISWDDY